MALPNSHGNALRWPLVRTGNKGRHSHTFLVNILNFAFVIAGAVCFFAPPIKRLRFFVWITASQDRNRVSRNAQGHNVVCAGRFRFGRKKGAAGVCHDRGDRPGVMDIESCLAALVVFLGHKPAAIVMEDSRVPPMTNILSAR